MSNFLVVAIAVFFDRLFGELSYYHPLRGFSHLAIYLEDHWHAQESSRFHTPPAKPTSVDTTESGSAETQAEGADKTNRALAMTAKLKGVIAVVTLVLPFVSIAGFASQNLAVPLNFVFDTFILYLALGAHSLKQHALDVQNSLALNDLEGARKHLALITTYDTKNLDAQKITATCIESILENGAVSILSPVFWFIIGGAPGVVLYALVHVLRNLWGYESSHYKDFAWLTLKIYNILNWLPARLASLSYMLLGNMKSGWTAFSEQAKWLKSANSDLLIISGAGSLGLVLGGDLQDHGETIIRPAFGKGDKPVIADISQSMDLVEKCLVLWLVVTLLISFGR